MQPVGNSVIHCSMFCADRVMSASLGRLGPGSATPISLVTLTHARHTLRRMFSGPSLRATAHPAVQGNDAVVDLHVDMRRVERKLPIELRAYVQLHLCVGGLAVHGCLGEVGHHF